MELYEFSLSGNCHKIRLMLSFLGLKYTSQLVDGSKAEQKSDSFRQKNPFGQVPVLVDEGIVIRDSQAILVYLARKYGEEHWFPMDALSSAQIMSWLSTSAGEISQGPNALRLHYRFGRVISLESAVATTEKVLNILETHLEENEWLATGSISIADVALYPYIALASEVKIDLTSFRNVRRWLGRIENLTGYVSMPGIQLQDQTRNGEINHA